MGHNGMVFPIAAGGVVEFEMGIEDVVYFGV
jgi:hypothetical protein